MIHHVPLYTRKSRQVASHSQYSHIISPSSCLENNDKMPVFAVIEIFGWQPLIFTNFSSPLIGLESLK